MRPRPRARVVLTDDEIAAQLRRDGVPQSEINERMAKRRGAEVKAQSDYDANRYRSKNDEAIDAARET